MRRREFIAGLGGAVAWPLVARAQQRLPVIGFLGPGSVEPNSPRIGAFRQGLIQAGFVEGRNVAIEYLWADNHLERLPALAADLVLRPVDLISTAGVPAVQAAMAATSTIPITFTLGVDPVALRIVASLNRPGGNVTGASTLGGELGAKRLELIHELVPNAMLIGVMLNPANPSIDSQKRELQVAAQNLGVRLQIVHASTESELDAGFATLIERRVGALVIGNEGLFIRRSEHLAALALRHAIPAVFQLREFAAAGGLMSYGGSSSDAWRLQGAYAGRILRGEKPGDLPVQQATRIELFINMKTAKALDLTIPETLLATADEVIQ